MQFFKTVLKITRVRAKITTNSMSRLRNMWTNGKMCLKLKNVWSFLFQYFRTNYFKKFTKLVLFYFATPFSCKYLLFNFQTTVGKVKFWCFLRYFDKYLKFSLKTYEIFIGFRGVDWSEQVEPKFGFHSSEALNQSFVPELELLRWAIWIASWCNKVLCNLAIFNIFPGA